MKIQFSAITHKGLIRERNEDSIVVSDQVLIGPESELSCEEVSLLKFPVICAVADGLGGHGRGDEASEYTVRRLKDLSQRIKSKLDLEEAITGIHRDLCMMNLEAPVRQLMGSTVCGVLFVDTTGIWFNVGDSRIYKINETELEQLSVDDVPFGGRDARTSSRITQCLGGGTRAIPLKIHLGEFTLQPNTHYLITSDGLTAFVDHQKIFESCLRNDSYQSVKKLIKLALHAGGEDNIAVALVSVY